MATNWDDIPVLGSNKLFDSIPGDYKLAAGNIVPCLLCAKPYLLGFFMGEIDQICPECEKTYGDTAKVVCVRCRPRATICRVIPKILDNGYYIRPRSILHVDKCNVCSPNLTESTIIEIREWERAHRTRKVILGPHGNPVR